MIHFQRKNIVITGAAGGLGRLFTLRFLALGARVAAWDINAEGLDLLKKEYENQESDAEEQRLFTYVCDISSPSEIVEAAGRTLADLSVVDIVLNNAGVVSGDWIEQLSDASIERTFAVNTLAPIRIAKAFLPSMISVGGGHFATVASAGGYVGTPRLSDYCASKSAVISFDESLRLEMKRRKIPITTTLISPYYIDSEMFSGVKTRFGWLLPILTPDRVVDRAIHAIYKEKPRLIMPWFVYTTFLCRVLPVGWFDAITTFFGVTRSMDGFVGHSSPSSSSGFVDAQGASSGEEMGPTGED